MVDKRWALLGGFFAFGVGIASFVTTGLSKIPFGILFSSALIFLGAKVIAEWFEESVALPLLKLTLQEKLNEELKKFYGWEKGIK